MNDSPLLGHPFLANPSLSKIRIVLVSDPASSASDRGIVVDSQDQQLQANHSIGSNGTTPTPPKNNLKIGVWLWCMWFYANAVLYSQSSAVQSPCLLRPSH